MLVAVILAAGEGKRMGKLKQLLPWKDSTILENVITNVIACNQLNQIRVVLGAEAERLLPLVKGFEDPRIKIKINREYQTGMLSSVKKGIEVLPEGTAGVMFVLGDQPMIPAEIFINMAEKYLRERPEIMVASYKMQRGHPVIFSSALLNEVDGLKGPGGLRGLLKKYPEKIEYVDVGREEVIVDLDYFIEYQKYKKIYGQE